VVRYGPRIQSMKFSLDIDKEQGTHPEQKRHEANEAMDSSWELEKGSKRHLKVKYEIGLTQRSRKVLRLLHTDYPDHNCLIGAV
jgi:hypothetical protein